MFRSIARTFVCVILLLALPLSVSAQGKLQDIVKRGELRVGMSGSQPPFTVKSKDGELMGFEVDLAMLLGKAMDVKVKLVEKPFAELLPALERGEIDAIMSGMTMTPQRNLKVAFVGPYLVSGKSILTKSVTLAAAQEVDEINESNLSFAALKSSTSQRFVELLLPEAKLVAVDDYDAGVKAVMDGSVDAMVADYPICVLTVLRHPDAGLATLSSPLTIEPIGMAVPPDDPLLVNMIENYLTALEMAGVMAALEEEWFDDGSWLVRLP